MEKLNDRVILERARSLAREAVWMVALQRARVKSDEPEDEDFPFRWWADLQFCIVALKRLRQAAKLAARAAPKVQAAIDAFNTALPALDTMRNVGEHIDEYAIDGPARRHTEVSRHEIQTGSLARDTTYSWLGHELNIDQAFDAAQALYDAVKTAASGDDER